jgi:hypothetical protein
MLSLVLAGAVALSGCIGHPGPGPHNGPSPIEVELIAALVGVAAEAGVLALTKSHLAASAAAGVTGVGAKYVIDEFDLHCSACKANTHFKNYSVSDSQPAMVECDNPNCGKHAYLIASYSNSQLNTALKQAQKEIPPTCLITFENEGEGTVRLTWRSESASSASLNGKTVKPNGSMVVHLAETTTYLLKVIGKYGSAEDTVTVEAESQEVGEAGESEVSRPREEAAATSSLPNTSPSPNTFPSFASAIPAEAPRREPLFAFLPAGSSIEGTLNKQLQTDRASLGEEFALLVDRPLMLNGQVVVPSGSRIVGSVADVIDSGRVEGRASITLSFESIDIGSKSYRISASQETRVAKSTVGRDVGKVAIGAGIGAAIGGALGGKKGAARGAAAGAGAGAGVVVATKGDPAQFRYGERLRVRLLEPVRVELNY